jgi:transcriptional regulator with XRE-family HTH domain
MRRTAHPLNITKLELKGVDNMYQQFNNIGTTIKMIREAKNIKQYALQAALNNTCNLSKFEANKTQIPLVTFHELLYLLNISNEEFFILHSMHAARDKPYYDTIADYLTYHAGRVDKKYIVEARSSLSLYAKESLHNIKTIKLKLLYHQLSCFYYLTFAYQPQKAQAHAAILLDYYTNVINLPSLSDLKLLPLIIPFVSIERGVQLLGDFDTLHSLQHDSHYHIIHTYLLAQLAFAKRCLLARNRDHFRKTLTDIDFFMMNFPTIDIYAETLILKGILFYDFDASPLEGIPLIQQGLQLAAEFQLVNIYNTWKRYTDYTYDFD